MARPCKRRRVCSMPGCSRFIPQGETRDPAVVMTLDEYECVRLIDLEGMTQEECAEQMEIARTTAQAVYNSARRKLADCMVNRRELHIEGGSYVLCEEHQNRGCEKKRFCRRVMQTNERVERQMGKMRIAVTYDNGTVFQHFGHTETFKLYEVENGTILDQQVVSSNGSGHGALAELLGGMKVDTLICGGIGGGARMALDDAGIKLYAGVTGDADAAVTALLDGTLSAVNEATCHHHDGETEHTCGEHGCGNHSCNG